MDREWAKQRMAEILQERTKLIRENLATGERVLDCSEVDEAPFNTPFPSEDESLLFVTDSRLVLYVRGSSESFPYSQIKAFKRSRAPHGVPLRRESRMLSISLATGQTRELLGGFMFFDSVVATLGEHT